MSFCFKLFNIFPALGECREFIFVVNTRQSRNESDPLHVVQNSITWSRENFSAKFQFFPANRLKFFFLSSNPGVAELKSKSDKIIDENFVKIFGLDAPNANTFELDIDYPQGTGLTLDVVAEVERILQNNLTTSTFSPNVLEITPVYNTQEKILDDDFFDGKSLRVKVDGNGKKVATCIIS